MLGAADLAPTTSFGRVVRCGVLVVRPHDAGFVRKDDGVDSIAQVQLAEQAVEVGLHGGDAEVELGGNFVVAEPASDKRQDLSLSCGEAVEDAGLLMGRRTAGELGEQSPRDRRCHDRLTAGDGANGFEELVWWCGLQHEAGIDGIPEVLVEVVRGEDQDMRPISLSSERACGLDSSRAWHPDVEEDDVWVCAGDHVDRFGTVLGFADNFHVGSGLDDQPQSGAHEGLIVDE